MARTALKVRERCVCGHCRGRAGPRRLEYPKLGRYCFCMVKAQVGY